MKYLMLLLALVMPCVANVMEGCDSNRIQGASDISYCIAQRTSEAGVAICGKMVFVMFYGGFDVEKASITCGVMSTFITEVSYLRGGTIYICFCDTDERVWITTGALRVLMLACDLGLSNERIGEIMLNIFDVTYSLY